MTTGLMLLAPLGVCVWFHEWWEFLGCETTAPCDTSFKARRKKSPYLLTYLLTYWTRLSVADEEQKSAARRRRYKYTY